MSNVVEEEKNMLNEEKKGRREIIVYSLLKISDRSVFGSIGKNIAYVKAEYGCDVTKLSVHQVRTKLHQQDKQVYANGFTVKELCDCRDGLKTIDNVCINDINELIYCICTT